MPKFVVTLTIVGLVGAVVEQDEDKITQFFDGLSITRGDSECRSFEKDPSRSTGLRLDELSEEQYNFVAYPRPRITFTCTASQGWGSYCGKGDKTYKAPNGAFFTVRDLARALAKWEGRTEKYGDHTFFEGFYRVGEGTFNPTYGS